MLPLRVVIDTNIVVSAALRPYGPQRTVFLLALTKPARMYVSREILAEYRSVLARPALKITKGHISEDIAGVAIDQNADLILMGRGKVRGTLGTLRTHACEIIRQAPCAVLSYSADEQEDESKLWDSDECTVQAAIAEL